MSADLNNSETESGLKPNQVDAPVELREILQILVKNFASLENDNDGDYWWGHDTNLGDQSEAFDKSIAAIQRYGRKQRIDELKNLDSLTYRFMSLGNDFDYKYRQSAVDTRIAELEAENE